MSLTLRDLFRIEMTVVMTAREIRLIAEMDMADPAASVDRKLHARNRLEAASDLDQAANLICGMQADWDMVGPLLRQGYVAMQLPEPAASSGDDAV